MRSIVREIFELENLVPSSFLNFNNAIGGDGREAI